MRIAIFCSGVVGKKGYARNLCLARGLVKLGDEVTLYICNDKFRFEKRMVGGVELILLPEILPYRMKKGGLGPIDTLARIIYMFKKDFDLVHGDVGFRPASGIPGHIYSTLKGVPYVCDWWDWVGHGGMLDRRSTLYKATLGALDNFFEEWDKKHANGVVTISRVLQERAKRIGIAEERTCVIHGGADIWTERYLAPEEVRSRYGLPYNAQIVGFAGMGPFEHRTILPFLEAIPVLKEKFPNFLWFSTGDPLPKHIQAKYGVGDEYIDLGWVKYEDYGPYLASANVLLLLLPDTVNSTARWPNKMGDYLAAGRPIIASDIGEVGHFARRFPGSVNLVKWSKDDVFKELSLLFDDPLSMKDIGQKNLDIAIGEYSWDAKASELHRFYERVLSLSQ